MTERHNCVLAADLGGTKIRAGVFGRDNRCLFALQRPTDVSAGRDAVVHSLCAALQQAAAWAEAQGLAAAGIGISTAGVVDAGRGVIADATDAIPQWRGTPLAALLREAFGLPVAVENDVKAALLGELCKSGELAADADLRRGMVVMLTLGTGLGGAIAEDGRLRAGRQFVAGHFGRSRVPDPWTPGLMTPLDALVSGTGLANIANHLCGQEQFENGHEVLQALAEGDSHAAAARDQFAALLAMVLENIYWTLDPAAVVLGGGLTEARAHWWPALQAALAARQCNLPLRPAALANDAGTQGAAQLIWQQLGEG
ncbi:N-acetyl-D-glucosamine kinase [Microbulbifer aestuariivivens]|uniref:N-acetyl-D-glucosamine kinase n=1 Tax=Microbulbifer aestuariivivens TaxID=1908308 RepID=A0ABP9WQM5_9GAMM